MVWKNTAHHRHALVVSEAYRGPVNTLHEVTQYASVQVAVAIQVAAHSHIDLTGQALVLQEFERNIEAYRAVSLAKLKLYVTHAEQLEHEAERQQAEELANNPPASAALHSSQSVRFRGDFIRHDRAPLLTPNRSDNTMLY